MTKNEQVTAFSLEGKTIPEIIAGLNEHLNSDAMKALITGHENLERFGAPCRWEKSPEACKMPERYMWLVAFAVEGSNEGWYVHLGAIQQDKYSDMGFVKLWDAVTAYDVAREAQRFLTNARWN